MAFTAYATVAETKAWVVLSDSVDDTVISDINDSVTAWIDEHCDRHFWQDGSVGSEVARTFVAGGPRFVDFGAFNDLTSLGTLTVETDEDGDGTYETIWASTDYQLQPVNRPTGRPYVRIEAVGTLLFPARCAPGTAADRVRITGIWGWAAVPEPVHQACLIQASRILKRRYSPEGVAGPSDFGVVRISRLDPDVMSLLDPFRRTGVLVA